MCLARQDSNPSMVREWRANLLAVGVSESMAAKAYRLLRAVLMTEVKEDEILAKNPCRIAGADQEKPSERPVLTIAQVLELADRVPARFKALVLVRRFGCLRWGEVSALQRQDLDLKTGAIRVRHAFTEQCGAASCSDLPSRKPAAGPYPFRRSSCWPCASISPITSTPDRRVRVHRTDRRRDPPWEPKQASALAADRCRNGRARTALPRPAAHWEHARRGHRRQRARPHGTDGPRQSGRGDDLPARHFGLPIVPSRRRSTRPSGSTTGTTATPRTDG